MNPTTHLALIDVFVGDIQGGLGPFLGPWLEESCAPGGTGAADEPCGTGTRQAQGAST